MVTSTTVVTHGGWGQQGATLSNLWQKTTSLHAFIKLMLSTEDSINKSSSERFYENEFKMINLIWDNTTVEPWMQKI